MFLRSDQVNFFGGVLPALYLSYISLKAYWEQIQEAKHTKPSGEPEEGDEGGEGDEARAVDEKPAVDENTFVNPLQAPGGEDAAVTKTVRTHEV